MPHPWIGLIRTKRAHSTEFRQRSIGPVPSTAYSSERPITKRATTRWPGSRRMDGDVLRHCHGGLQTRRADSGEPAHVDRTNRLPDPRDYGSGTARLLVPAAHVTVAVLEYEARSTTSGAVPVTLSTMTL